MVLASSLLAAANCSSSNSGTSNTSSCHSNNRCCSTYPNQTWSARQTTRWDMVDSEICEAGTNAGRPLVCGDSQKLPDEPPQTSPRFLLVCASGGIDRVRRVSMEDTGDGEDAEWRNVWRTVSCTDLSFGDIISHLGVASPMSLGSSPACWRRHLRPGVRSPCGLSMSAVGKSCSRGADARSAVPLSDGGRTSGLHDPKSLGSDSDRGIAQSNA